MVPQARIPGTKSAAVGVAALQPPEGAVLANSLTTMAVGTAGVRVLLIKSLLADSDVSPFGVTKQVQQEISCSSGENV